MALNLARVDWHERLASGKSLVPDLPLDRKLADRALTIFNRLRLPDVPGTPTLKEAGGEWFRDILAAQFGSIDQHGTRLVRELLLEVPKKNSKITAGAAVMLTALMLNKRPRAEFLLIGPTQAISELAFIQGVGMIMADAELAKRFRVEQHVKRITYQERGAATKATFDSKMATESRPTVDRERRAAGVVDRDRARLERSWDNAPE